MVDETRRLTTAYHEAAHAVARHLLGGVFDCIRIPKSRIGGAVFFGGHELDAESEVMIALAGNIGAGLLSRDVSRHGLDDKKHIRRLATSFGVDVADAGIRTYHLLDPQAARRAIRVLGERLFEMAPGKLEYQEARQLIVAALDERSD